MFNFDASGNNKVVCLNQYIDRKYISINEIVDNLNHLTVIPITVPMIWTLLSMRGLVVEHSQYGHLITEDAKPYTTRKYNNDCLEVLWNKEKLIPLLTEEITRLFKG